MCSQGGWVGEVSPVLPKASGKLPWLAIYSRLRREGLLLGNARMLLLLDCHFRFGMLSRVVARMVGCVNSRVAVVGRVDAILFITGRHFGAVASEWCVVQNVVRVIEKARVGRVVAAFKVATCFLNAINAALSRTSGFDFLDHNVRVKLKKIVNAVVT